MQVQMRRRLRWRSVLRVWHRWFGLGASLWLLLLALTGSAITFYDELDTWLNPDLRTVDAAAAVTGVAVSVEVALRNAQAALPGFEPRHVDLPNVAGETVWMLGRVVDDAGVRGVQVFVHPFDGQVLGWREIEHLALDRRHLMDVLYGLHIDLMLGPMMTWLLGLVALLWVFDHVAALLLAVPRRIAWRDAFRVAGQPGSGRRRLDLHRAPGMWLLALTFVMALTGVTLAWPDASRDAVRLVSPVSERLDFSFPETSDAMRAVDADQAIALGARDKDAQVDSLRVLPHVGAYAVRTFHPRDLDDQGRMWTYVSMADGRILGRRHDNGDSPGDLFFAWQYPLHSGKAFGLAGRIAVCIAGLVTAALCITGLWLWWRRRRWIPARRGLGPGENRSVSI